MKQAKDGTLPNQKVDWLRVVIEEIEAQGDHVHNGIMKVRDPTGIQQLLLWKHDIHGSNVQEKSHVLFIKM